MRCGTQCDIAYRLRNSVTLQQPTTPSTGETNPSYSDVTTVRAEVLPIRGREGTNGRQVEATVTWKVTFRHRDNIGPDWRIKWGSRTLNIVSVYDPTQMGRVLVAECVEVQP